ncbi:Uma2 family endonuclease [Sphaerisporangium sp. TRM90804]|uniref:Uma2 family endonuclease n=1 Tax=Sphaerisporangium sp. TRM90804 TaxID=3031113 RepID=UPI00244B9D8E|nr:Uma2 family endonuclease [Sphaerisporangium sp. TRM90804]MDH2423901.1 Uma2 family endonuclease [Sphaerisporangium sp. TRM90804]
MRPPPEGFTAGDLDHFPDLPAHTQLLDGSLVFVSPQASFHTLLLYVLENGLRRNLPEDLRLRREMSVALGPRQCPQPDVVVIRATADLGPMVTAYQAADVVIAIEVVTPDSEIRDRERKPQLYAKAGIRHFWRVEQDADRATVYVYELDPATLVYVPMGIYHDKLQLTVPFEIDIDLTEIERL